MNQFNIIWKNFKFKYLSLVVIGILVAIILAGNKEFNFFLHGLGTLEYLGAFFAGILFVSSLTVPTSIVVISIVSQDINPLALALIGAAGATMGDMIIFRFVKDHLSEELALLLTRSDRRHLQVLIHTPYIAWMLPLLGALIIASPLPDELGVSLLGLSNITDNKLVLISYFSNALGILAVASVARIF